MDPRKAKFLAAYRLPYFSKLAYNAVLIETSSVETMATDGYCRVYVNPLGVAEWTLENGAWVFVHELSHIFLRHDARSKVRIGLSPSEDERRLWNIAGDITINRTIREVVFENCQQAAVEYRLPEGCVDHQDRTQFPFHLPDNAATEQYYNILLENKEKIHPGLMQSFAKGGSQDSGSGADGQPREWEVGAPAEAGKETKDSVYGLDEYNRKQVERLVAHDMVEASKKMAGRLGGEFGRMAEKILKPRFDPRREIMSEVKYSLNCIKGFGQSTWRMPNRRTPPRGLRLPANICPVPMPLIIVDTSASMDQKALSLCLGVIAEVIKSMPSRAGVHVVSGDTHIGKCQQAFSARAVELVGGGGTDMGRIMVESYAKYPQTDVILVVTDGYTPWPAQPLGPKCLALVTDADGCGSTPEWIRELFIRPEMED